MARFLYDCERVLVCSKKRNEMGKRHLTKFQRKSSLISSANQFSAKPMLRLRAILIIHQWSTSRSWAEDQRTFSTHRLFGCGEVPWLQLGNTISALNRQLEFLIAASRLIIQPQKSTEAEFMSVKVWTRTKTTHLAVLRSIRFSRLALSASLHSDRFLLFV